MWATALTVQFSPTERWNIISFCRAPSWPVSVIHRLELALNEPVENMTRTTVICLLSCEQTQKMLQAGNGSSLRPEWTTGGNNDSLRSVTLLLVFLVQMDVQTGNRVNTSIQNRGLCSLYMGLYTWIFQADLFWIPQEVTGLGAFKSIDRFTLHPCMSEYLMEYFFHSCLLGGCIINSSYWGCWVSMKGRLGG